jgi:hypothetical protein
MKAREKGALTIRFQTGLVKCSDGWKTRYSIKQWLDELEKQKQESRPNLADALAKVQSEVSRSKPV